MYLITTLLAILIISPIRSETNCTDSVDITDGNFEGTAITKNGLTYDENNYFREGNNIQGCICNLKGCIKKCCESGQVFNETSKECYDSLNDDLGVGYETYNIIKVRPNNICTQEEIQVQVPNFEVRDGSLLWEGTEYPYEDYCLYKVDDTVSGLVCVVPDDEATQLITTCLGMIISMPFLLVTFLVYLILPDSNIHRRALMFYVLNLLLAYISLVTIQLHEDGFDRPFCDILGYSVVFFFMASFLWMNVMCADIWFAFRGMRGFNGRQGERGRRFLYYSLYAWGIPVLLVLILFLLNKFGNPEAIWYPGIGVTLCFLNRGLSELLYFYGPMAVIISIDILLFVLTAVKIRQVKNETSVLKQSDSKRHSYEDEQQKFNLYLKLLFAMGINWSMELISWAISWKVNSVPSYVWYLTDFFNAMYGVCIFFIFVFKKKIWKSLQKRYYVFIGKPHLARSMTTTTQTTRSSNNYSTTDASLHDQRLSDLREKRAAEERALTSH